LTNVEKQSREIIKFLEKIAVSLVHLKLDLMLDVFQGKFFILKPSVIEHNKMTTRTEVEPHKERSKVVIKEWLPMYSIVFFQILSSTKEIKEKVCAQSFFGSVRS